MKTLDRILMILGVTTVIFIVTVFGFVWLNKSVPDSLIYSYFGALGGEGFVKILINNVGEASACLTALAFGVSIIVQLTKGYIKIPTKLWALTVSFLLCTVLSAAAISEGIIPLSFSCVAAVILASFLVGYVSMYGFDTLKELWNRFKEGGGMNE